MITVTHNAGFFSCNTLRLYKIIEYYNIHKKIPSEVDSSQQYEWYKRGRNDDITFDFFQNYKNINNSIIINEKINFHWDDQFIDYNSIDYLKIWPFVEKYFTPTKDIQDLVEYLEKKYNITNYDNICTLFYRGLCKYTETAISTHDDVIIRAKKLLEKNPSMQFIIQSDETEYIERLLKEFPDNTIYFKDEILHATKTHRTQDIVDNDKIMEYTKNLLAITLIESKCKYIICGSNNCSLWIMLYRKHCFNVQQYLNSNWLES
jgi:hypothetical protein